MTLDIPATWPEDHRPALKTLLREAGYARRRDTIAAVKRFCMYCNKESLPVRLTVRSFRGFETDQYATLAKASVRNRMCHLYRLGIMGPDLDLRDFLFENFPDKRSVDTMLQGPWWPNFPRLLTGALASNDRRRMIRELDNFFRWRQRTAALPVPLRLQTLFLSERLQPLTRYRRLSLLCNSLDAVLPGDADLAALRVEQKALYRGNAMPPEKVRPAARRIPEVETLLAAHRDPRTGKPVALATEVNHRAALNLHYDILARKGLPLSFDKAALDLFADCTHAKLDAWKIAKEDASGNLGVIGVTNGWCLRSAATKCMALAPFIANKQLKRAWYTYALDFARTAKKRGEPKLKELALTERPMDLSALFLRAQELQELADAEVDIQVRHGILTVIGALGVLLFYPLRKADLLKLLLGQHLVRETTCWLLAPQSTQKTGEELQPLRLPQEATQFLDACFLGGVRRENLKDIYRHRFGEPLLQSPRRSAAYESGAFATLFKRWVGHSPHTIRSIWCDDLIARGADRITISIVLQHKEILSQEEYEVLAKKMRAIAAVEAIWRIADRVSRD